MAELDICSEPVQLIRAMKWGNQKKTPQFATSSELKNFTRYLRTDFLYLVCLLCLFFGQEVA